MDTAKLSGDVDLNDFFRSMSEVDQEERDWKHHIHFVLSKIHLLSEFTEQAQHNPIKFRVFGSSAEDLKCCLPNDIGDIDIMVYPVAEETIIDDSIIEYVEDFIPIYVRLRGKDHPVLQHCLDENSDFVATSSLKGLHPKLFGERWVLNAIPNFFERIDCLDPGSMSTGVFNNPSGPACQIAWKHSFGSMTEQVEGQGQVLGQFTKTDDFRNLLEWLAVSFNPSRVFTEEHSACIDEFLEVAQEKFKTFNESPDVEKYFALLNELMSSKKLYELKQKVQGIDQRVAKANEGTAMLDNAASGHALPNGPRNESVEVVSTVEKVTDDINTNLTLPTFSQNREGTSDESKNNCKAETSQGPPEEPTILSDNKSTTEVVKKWLLQQLLDNIFDESASVSSNTKEKLKESSECIESGIDLVPALKAKGWPRAASSWPTRLGRAWPSQDIISKILDSGFHVVVKTPRDADQREELQFFRLSFSCAELILSGELNNVQRDCYRCLKILHRFVAKQQQCDVTSSYLLKNILFWTLEETEVDFWRESNRAACVLILVERFYKSLESKHLPHYFVPEYNLLEEAVRYYPEEVEHLAGEFRKICKNPSAYSKAEMMPKMSKKDPLVEAPLGGRHCPVPQRKADAGIENEQSVETTFSNDNTASAGASSKLFLKYTDFLKIYKEICRELIHLVLEESNSHQTDDSTVATIVDNLRKVASKLENPESELMTILNHNTEGVYSSHVAYPGNSTRQRILEALKEESKIFAYVVAQEDLLEVGKEDLIIQRMINSGNLDMSSLFSNYWEVLKQTFSIFDSPSLLTSKDDDDIPLD